LDKIYIGPTILTRRSTVYLCLDVKQRTHSISTEKATFSASDEDSIADVMEQHDEFISSMQNRSTKLKVLIIEFLFFYDLFSVA
jgi:katanin p80 WD40 repeat-containing subunit B1